MRYLSPLTASIMKHRYILARKIRDIEGNKMLTIIARPTVDPERIEEIKAAMLDLVETTLKEEGSIRYELHQDNNEPNEFTFVETWENRKLWQKHMEGSAIKEFNERILRGIQDFELSELTKVNP